MKPADAMQRIVSSNGFTEESEYDSDELLKTPYPDGGGEADSPQHCEGCGLFLELRQRGAHRACSIRGGNKGASHMVRYVPGKDIPAAIANPVPLPFVRTGAPARSIDTTLTSIRPHMPVLEDNGC
jgi:hypothetical protein